MYQVKKSYRNHFGLNYKRNDLTRPVEFATITKNAAYRASTAINKRLGSHPHAATQGGLGLYAYDKKNPDTGADLSEVVTVGQGLSRAKIANLAVSYGGASSPALFSVIYDVATSQYRAQITEGTTQPLDLALGMPYDTGSPVTLATLATAINGIAGFVATVTGTNTTPAAFLEIVRDHDLTAGAASLDALYWEAVNTTVSNPFNTFYGHRNDTDFENMSSCQLNNVLYLSGGGYDWVHKYDGQTLYRAGLPNVASLAAAIGGAGAITGTNYLYKAQYIQYDAAGNIIEGNLIATANLLGPAAQNIDVTVANIQAATGFNTNCATVNGNQVGVNAITVNNSPHTMKVGDKAYFLDRSSGAYVVRNVTAVAATSVTVDGAVVNVNNGDVISNNLRIALWRSKSSGSTPTIWYLVAEIPNNSLAATQVYTDSKTDANLGARLIEPLTDRSTPPKVKYLAPFQNQMVIGGDPVNPRTVSWSDVESAEYFPNDDNQEDVQSEIGDILSAMAPIGEVFAVFTKKTTTIVSGLLSENDIRFELKTSDVGCEAMQTLRDVAGELCWWSDKGPFHMAPGALPRPLGEEFDEDGRSLGGRIDTVVNQVNVTLAEQLNFKRAISYNDRDNKHYITFIPSDSTTGGNKHSNSFSTAYVFDYDRGAWLQWFGMDMTSGIVHFRGETYFQERRYSSFLTAVSHVLFRRLRTDEADSYQDDNRAIDWDYGTGWEALGSPSVYKKYLRMLLYQLEETKNNTSTLTVEQEVDYVKDVPKTDFTFSLQGGGYGVAEYGVAAYGNPAEDYDDRSLASGKFLSTRFRFKNSVAQQNVIITGWDMECATPYKPKVPT